MLPASKILIVEDEEVLAANLRDYFLKRAAEVQLAGSGESALARARVFQPDLVLTDFGLPGMDGLDTIVELRRICPQVRCVLMTGHPTDAIFRAAHELGIGCVLEKPFSFSALESIVPSDAYVAAEMESDGYRISATRRRGERRHVDAASLPFETTDGWVTRERRALDRRRMGDRREAQASAAG